MRPRLGRQPRGFSELMGGLGPCCALGESALGGPDGVNAELRAFRGVAGQLCAAPDAKPTTRRAEARRQGPGACSDSLGFAVRWRHGPSRGTSCIGFGVWASAHGFLVESPVQEDPS
jgi:hypothetical protein